MTSRAGPCERARPVAEQLGRDRERCRRHGARETLDAGAVRGLRTSAHGVGDVHHFVALFQRLDAREGEADLRVEAADDQSLAPGRLHRVAEDLSSNAFIDVRSIGSIPSSSDRIDGSVGPLKPARH